MTFFISVYDFIGFHYEELRIVRIRDDNLSSKTRAILDWLEIKYSKRMLEEYFKIVLRNISRTVILEKFQEGVI